MVTPALVEPLAADPIVEAAAADAADADAPTPTDAADKNAEDPTARWPSYLLQFMHRFLDMREAEAQACAALAGVPLGFLPLALPPAVTVVGVEEAKAGENLPSSSSSSPSFVPALPQAGDTASREEEARNSAFRTIRLPGPEAAAELLRRSMLVRVRTFFFFFLFFFLFLSNEKNVDLEKKKIQKKSNFLFKNKNHKKNIPTVHPRRLGRRGLHGSSLQRFKAPRSPEARRGSRRRIKLAPLGRRLWRRRGLGGDKGGLREAGLFRHSG